MQIPFNMIHCTYAYEKWLKLFVFLQLQKHVPFIDQMTNRHILARMTKQATLKSHGLEPRYSFKFISAETQWFITSFHPFAHFWMGTMLREDVTYGYPIVISCIYLKVCPVMSPFASYIPNLSHVGQVHPNVQSVDPPVWTMFCMSSRYAPRSQQLDTQKVNPSPVIFKRFVQVHRYLSMIPIALLVGGIPTPVKNMTSSVGIIPSIWKNKSYVPNHQPVLYRFCFTGWTSATCFFTRTLGFAQSWCHKMGPPIWRRLQAALRDLPIRALADVCNPRHVCRQVLRVRACFGFHDSTSAFDTMHFALAELPCGRGYFQVNLRKPMVLGSYDLRYWGTPTLFLGVEPNNISSGDYYYSIC